MYNAEYSPVIGWENPIIWGFGLGPYKRAISPASHGVVFCILHQTTKFRQTTVYNTVVAPCHFSIPRAFSNEHVNSKPLALNLEI
jgi:hypothetical protein